MNDGGTIAGANILCPIWKAMKVIFMAVYDFDVSKFVSREMKDRVVGSEKALLEYPCVIA